MLSTGVSLACFMIYTLGFCRRLGVVDDIDSAEARRSRRLGVTRVSKWSMVTRSQDFSAQMPSDFLNSKVFPRVKCFVGPYAPHP